MQELIKRLEEEIKSEIEYSGNDFDDRNWVYQCGLLISVNEAIKIVEILKANSVENRVMPNEVVGGGQIL